MMDTPQPPPSKDSPRSAREKAPPWRLSRQRSARLIVALALLGLVLSGFLTVVKFESAFHCDRALMSSCSGGGLFGCDSVLTSPWSTFGGSGADAYPITILSSTFYALVFVLGVNLLHRRPRGVTESVLLCLAWAGVAASVPLAIYAYAVVRAVCLFCTSLYLVNIGLLLAVLLLDPAGQRHQLRGLLRRGDSRTLTLLLVGLFFIAASMVQMLVYRVEANDAGTEPRCTIAAEEPLAGGLRYPLHPLEDGAREEFVLVVSLACHHCKQALRSWIEEVERSGGRYSLRVFPVATDHECIGGYGRDAVLPSVASLNPCAASVAVACAQQVAPDRAFEYMRRILDQVHEDSSTEPFSEGRLFDLTEGIDELARDTTTGRAFEGCLKGLSGHAEALDQIRYQSEDFIDRRNLTVPSTLVHFYDEHGGRFDQGLRLVGKKEYPNMSAFLQRARADLRVSAEEAPK